MNGKEKGYEFIPDPWEADEDDYPDGPGDPPECDECGGTGVDESLREPTVCRVCGGTGDA